MNKIFFIRRLLMIGLPWICAALTGLSLTGEPDLRNVRARPVQSAGASDRAAFHAADWQLKLELPELCEKSGRLYAAADGQLSVRARIQPIDSDWSRMPSVPLLKWQASVLDEQDRPLPVPIELQTNLKTETAEGVPGIGPENFFGVCTLDLKTVPASAAGIRIRIAVQMCGADPADSASADPVFDAAAAADETPPPDVEPAMISAECSAVSEMIWLDRQPPAVEWLDPLPEAGAGAPDPPWLANAPVYTIRVSDAGSGLDSDHPEHWLSAAFPGGSFRLISSTPCAPGADAGRSAETAVEAASGHTSDAAEIRFTFDVPDDAVAQGPVRVQVRDRVGCACEVCAPVSARVDRAAPVLEHVQCRVDQGDARPVKNGDWLAVSVTVTDHLGSGVDALRTALKLNSKTALPVVRPIEWADVDGETVGRIQFAGRVGAGLLRAEDLRTGRWQLWIGDRCGNVRTADLNQDMPIYYAPLEQSARCFDWSGTGGSGEKRLLKRGESIAVSVQSDHAAVPFGYIRSPGGRQKPLDWTPVHPDRAVCCWRGTAAVDDLIASDQSEIHLQVGLADAAGQRWQSAVRSFVLFDPIAVGHSRLDIPQAEAQSAVSVRSGDLLRSVVTFNHPVQIETAAFGDAETTWQMAAEAAPDADSAAVCWQFEASVPPDRWSDGYMVPLSLRVRDAVGQSAQMDIGADSGGRQIRYTEPLRLTRLTLKALNSGSALGRGSGQPAASGADVLGPGGMLVLDYALNHPVETVEAHVNGRPMVLSHRGSSGQAHWTFETDDGMPEQRPAVVLEAVDAAGQHLKQTVDAAQCPELDRTPGEIALSRLPPRYAHEPYAFDVRFSDRHPDPDRISFLINGVEQVTPAERARMGADGVLNKRIVLAEEGTYRLRAAVGDRAGNQRQWPEDVVLTLDRTDPELLRADWLDERMQVVRPGLYLTDLLTVRDAHPGTVRCWLFDRSGVHPWDPDRPILTVGRVQVQAEAVDLAGNVSSRQRCTLYVDAAPPRVRMRIGTDGLPLPPEQSPPVLRLGETVEWFLESDGLMAQEPDHWTAAELERPDGSRRNLLDAVPDSAQSNRPIRITVDTVGPHTLRLAAADAVGNKMAETDYRFDVAEHPLPHSVEPLQAGRVFDSDAVRPVDAVRGVFGASARGRLWIPAAGVLTALILMLPIRRIRRRRRRHPTEKGERHDVRRSAAKRYDSGNH